MLADQTGTIVEGVYISTFTPGVSCLGSDNIWQIIIATTFCSDIAACSEYLLQGPPSTSDCLPPSYGPGAIYHAGCPSGYTKACTVIETVVKTAAAFLDATSTVTSVQICCPT